MIPVAKPYITKEDQKAVADAVASGWILQGPKVATFEALLAEHMGVKHAVATSSCTTALHIALITLGVGKGDEVIVPSFSYIASANCIVHAGAVPVFVDIDPRTYNLDPEAVARAVTRKTKAIIAVHQIGLAADMAAIMAIAKKHSLFVIEDAACALGATIRGKHVGRFGHISAFSFHPRKAITTAEGGLLVTKNNSWAKTARMLRAHGSNMSVAARHQSHTVQFESFPVVGYNYRMSDIHAALGISQFRKFDYIMRRRQEIAASYTQAFADDDRIVTPFVPDGFHHTYQSYMVRIRGGNRVQKKIMQRMLDDGVATRRGVMTSHEEAPYRLLYPKLKLPHTELALRECIVLPIYTELTKAEQDRVVTALHKALKLVL